MTLSVALGLLLSACAAGGGSNGGDPTPQPIITLTPGNHDVGGVIVGQSVTRHFTVGNGGTGTLTGNASVSGNDFRIDAGSGYSLTPSQSQTVVVRFSPTAAVTYAGTLTLTGGGGSSASLTGSGAPLPSMRLTPSETSCSASTAIDERCEVTISLRNGSGSYAAAGFQLVSERFDITGVSPTDALEDACPLAFAGPTGMVGIVCASAPIAGEVAIATLSMRRVAAGGGLLTTTDAYLVTEQGMAIHTDGGTLEIP